MEPDGYPTRFRAFPPVVTTLLVANGLVFLLQQSGQATAFLLLDWFALWPLGTPEALPAGGGAMMPVPEFQIWQLFTYAFLHGNLLHLFSNMLALWMFGIQLENFWGSRALATYFVVCAIGAGLIQLIVASTAAAEGAVYPTLGASGGVFGILLAFGMMFPNQRIVLLFPPIPMKAKWFVILYGAFSLYAGLTGSFSGVAHFAHLGGMLFGFIMIQYWRGRLPVKPRRRLLH